MQIVEATFAKRKYKTTNICPNFHFGHATYFVFTTRYHSQPKQILIMFERILFGYMFKQLYVYCHAINFIKLKI